MDSESSIDRDAMPVGGSDVNLCAPSKADLMSQGESRVPCRSAVPSVATYQSEASDGEKHDTKLAIMTKTRTIISPYLQSALIVSSWEYPMGQSELSVFAR